MGEKPLAAPSGKAWVSLITKMEYLPGLLTLNHRLRAVESAYPLVALYTDSFPAEGRDALAARGIAIRRVPFLTPANAKEYIDDPRFNDCWTKLVVFSLTEFARIVQLDSDMLVMRNMDELMDLELDPPSISESGDKTTSRRVFAASHACVCNPLKKSHYPKNWIPENCAFTTQHADPDTAQSTGADPACSLGDLNSGLLVVNPSDGLYRSILEHMDSHGGDYVFPDQDLLADLYRGRWVALPYVYNALKTMRDPDVHGAIWRDDRVKNIHYILSPKPWNEIGADGSWTGQNPIYEWWVNANRERQRVEAKQGIVT